MYLVTTISCRPFSVPFAFSLQLCISYFLINYLTVWRNWKTNTLPRLCTDKRWGSEGIRSAWARSPHCLSVCCPVPISSRAYVGEILTASFNGIISLSLPYPPANPINHILIFASLSLKANHYLVFVIWFLKLHYSVPSSSITGCHSRNRRIDCAICCLLAAGGYWWRFLKWLMVRVFFPSCVT